MKSLLKFVFFLNFLILFVGCSCPTYGPTQNSNQKETPLFIALENDYSDIAEYLISKGAHVNIKNRQGKYPLHIAAYKGNLELAKRLVSRGAGINAQDMYDITPLHDAANTGQLEIVKYLVSHGATVNIKGAALIEWSPL